MRCSYDVVGVAPRARGRRTDFITNVIVAHSKHRVFWESIITTIRSRLAEGGGEEGTGGSSSDDGGSHQSVRGMVVVVSRGMRAHTRPSFPSFVFLPFLLGLSAEDSKCRI